jgi:hypothetical protein
MRKKNQKALFSEQEEPLQLLGNMIYPVRDSHSYILPYDQREHAWNDDQYDRSDEV